MTNGTPLVSRGAPGAARSSERPASSRSCLSGELLNYQVIEAQRMEPTLAKLLANGKVLVFD
jgi:hypothetical protein